MAMLNGQYIHVTSEEPGYEVDITDQPVENGADTTDHVQRKARTLSLSGLVVGGDAAQIRVMIISAMEKGQIVTFTGRTTFTGLIASFTPKHDHKVADGFTFSMSLKEIRIAKTSYVGTLPAPIRTQAAPIINSGVKQAANATTGKTTTKKTEVQKVKFKAGSPWAEGG